MPKARTIELKGKSGLIIQESHERLKEIDEQNDGPPQDTEDEEDEEFKIPVLNPLVVKFKARIQELVNKRLKAHRFTY